MSSDKRFILSKVRAHGGVALDVGGGRGELEAPLRQRGWTYVNVDIGVATGPRAVVGDAGRLPFRDGSFGLVASNDSLEPFAAPARALGEIRRVLRPDGQLVAWVPFLHPFHGDDFYRYTPVGLQFLFAQAGLQIEEIEAPLRLFSVLAQVLVAALQRVRLGRLERLVERVG